MFSSIGKTPFDKDRLNKYVSGCDIYDTTFFTIFTSKPSQPGLVNFSDLIMLHISSSCVRTINIDSDTELIFMIGERPVSGIDLAKFDPVLTK